MRKKLLIIMVMVISVFVSNAQTVIKGDISTATGKDIVSEAMEHIGTPYRYGVSNPNRGFDCSGFTSYIYKQMDISLPRSSSGQFQKETEITDPRQLKKGDLVFFKGRSSRSRNIGHVGIVTNVNRETGEFSFIHASCSKGVTITKSTEKYYAKRYISACRILENPEDVEPFWIPTFKIIE